jgi:Tol biopolymer transport system component
VDTATGAVRRLARGKVTAAAFSPNGRQLAMIFQQDGDHCHIYVLDLPDPQ